MPKKKKQKKKLKGLKAEYSLDIARDLEAVHGIDTRDELVNILCQEILQEVNREIIRTIYNNPQELFKSEEYQRFMEEIYGAQKSKVIRIEEHKSGLQGTLIIVHPKRIEERMTAANKLREYLEKAHPRFAFYIHNDDKYVEIAYSWNSRFVDE